LAQEIKLSGLVATNTTISRKGLVTDKDTLEKIGAGGLSCMPLKEKSTQMVHYINRQTNGSIPLIASGGVFKGKDAAEKLAAGASLVQLWTGFVYEGPGIVNSICRELAD
jgi:dihydroorotate dehydrogenase